MGIIYKNNIVFSGGGDSIQVETPPTPDATQLNKILQYVGPTGSGFINGYFYECVEDESNPGTYIWLTKDVQLGGHQILNEGVSLSARTGLNFTDFDLEDNSTLDQTEIQAHAVTSHEFDEIFAAPPSVSSFLPARGFTPVGTVITVIGVNAPSNYVECDGTVYPISTYPDLAAYFSSQFGVANYYGGDGTTTFAVPNLTVNSLTDAKFCIAVKNIFIQETLDFTTYEKVVGTWIDGKPLYQKTVEPNFSITNGVELTLNNYISNVAMLFVDVEHSWLTKDNGDREPLSFSPSNVTTYGVTYYYVTSTNKLRFYTGSNVASENLKLVLLTIQYTKTTD